MGFSANLLTYRAYAEPSLRITGGSQRTQEQPRLTEHVRLLMPNAKAGFSDAANRYVSRVFWSMYRSRPTGYFDENRFRRAARRGGRSTVEKLELVFDRMYILRNQVFRRRGGTREGRKQPRCSWSLIR